MTFGDVLAGMAVLAATVMTLCASTVLVYLAIGRRVNTAKQLSFESPFKTGWKGLFVLAGAIFCFVEFSTTTIAPLKVLFALLLLAPASLSLVGSAVLIAGVSSVVSPADDQYPSVKALIGRALLCLSACLTPLIGWFVLAPALLLFTAGAGLNYILSVIKRTAVSPTAKQIEVLS